MFSNALRLRIKINSCAACEIFGPKFRFKLIFSRTKGGRPLEGVYSGQLGPAGSIEPIKFALSGREPLQNGAQVIKPVCACARREFSNLNAANGCSERVSTLFLVFLHSIGTFLVCLCCAHILWPVWLILGPSSAVDLLGKRLDEPVVAGDSN